MSKKSNKQVTKKEMVYAINLCIRHIEEQDARLLMLSSLVHNYIELNKDVEKLKKYLEDKNKEEQKKQNKKEKKDAN